MVNILVIEDERLIARLLKDILEVEGYQAISIFNGEEAVQFALRDAPQLIILDIMLPGIDGYEVIRRLREHPKSMHIPIIVLSAYSSPTDKAHAFDLGVDGYITKPFNADELLACVRRQLIRMQQSSLSPLTLLPGGLQLERAINYKINGVDPWSILYLDLDNFKAFNDVYGFLAGNSMILLVGQICQQVARDHGNVEDFVGHVGGDDFVVVTTPDRVKILCYQILIRYKKESQALYHPDDRERGTISGVDRKGRPYQFPLVSLSIGVVSSQFHYPHSLEEIGALAAEAKRRAKQSPDNVFCISSKQSRPTQGYSHALQHVLPPPHPYTPARLPQDRIPGKYKTLYLVEDVLAEFK
jgi:diguanylate cyclase (GGDEF)-like protein